MLFFYFIGIILINLPFQFAVNHSINFDKFFQHFAKLQHWQNIQQQKSGNGQCSSSSNTNSSSKNTNSNNSKIVSINKSAKMHYRATISPPGRYGVIAWDGFLNSNEECREKVLMSDNKEKLYFLTNALKEPNLLKECFMHFYLAHSDVNGQFVLEHNLVVENAKDDNVWCLLWNSTNYISKRWWSGNVPNFEEPTRIVHLQIIPVDEKLKIVIPSLFNKNIAAQITRDYQAKDLCSTKIEDNNSSSGQQLASLNQTESKEIIEYHPSNKRAQIVNKILNQWTNSVELVAHENAFFLVAYLRWVVFEVESCVENDNNSNVRDNVVVLMSKYDKIGVLMLKYGDALLMAFQKARKIINIATSDSNFVAEILAMTNRMCSFMRSVPNFFNIFKSWQTLCNEFDVAYRQFSKKRNKIVFSLLDSCLFGKKVCLIDELIIYYVEHLVFQSERIVADTKSKNNQINEHDLNFLAQIGQILSVARKNNLDEHNSYLEHKLITLGRMNALFERLCKNWQEFVGKIKNTAKFKAWTELCKLNVFKNVLSFFQTIGAEEETPEEIVEETAEKNMPLFEEQNEIFIGHDHSYL